MNICPVNGAPCNKDVVFVITEQLGNKAQSTSCCRDCAIQHIQMKNNMAVNKYNVALSAQDFIDKIFQTVGTGEIKFVPNGLKMPEKTCSNCGITYSEVLATGRLGCATCWESFQEELKPVLDKHQHKSIHAGKTPKQFFVLPEQLDPNFNNMNLQDQIKYLENNMNEAVKKEDFDAAAKYRDLIKKIKNK